MKSRKWAISNPTWEYAWNAAYAYTTAYCKFYEDEPDLTDVSVEAPDEARLSVAREAIKILGNKINDEIKYNIMKTVFEKWL